jgi:hypothetical protein
MLVPLIGRWTSLLVPSPEDDPAHIMAQVHHVENLKSS